MGACVSTHPKKPANSSILKRFISYRFRKKENDNPVNSSVSSITFKPKPPSLTCREMSSFSGSKEETFFDAPTWINSSVDDDFFSVRGNFTPSCTSTPSKGNSFIMRSSVDSGIRMSSRSKSLSGRREQIKNQDNVPENISEIRD